VIFQKIFAKSDNSDLLGNSFNFKGKANLWIKTSRINEPKVNIIEMSYRRISF
jgi:hypothetical protein